MLGDYHIYNSCRDLEDFIKEFGYDDIEIASNIWHQLHINYGKVLQIFDLKEIEELSYILEDYI